MDQKLNKLLQRTRDFLSDPRIGSTLQIMRERVGWGQFVTLGAILVCSGGLWAFAEIADDAFEGESESFDRTVMLMFRTASDTDDPVGPDWLETIFSDITALGGFATVTLVALAAIGYLAILRQWGTIVLIVVSFVGGTLLNNVLKGSFDRPRPDLVSHLVEVQTASFPSGHAMLSAVAYLTIGALLAQVQPRRRLKIYIFGVTVVLTLLIGFSRIYLGVHWPTDVLAGWSIGAAWAMGCWLVARFVVIRRSRRID